ncbi:STM3941 family protein [Pontixanthobacter aquaemixtae]|uniref:PH domain-containing protein n=1 Tax=Pontixanthobacter aquaemixtae TaxID=1958940 RepID=A0A844ZT18_9SPHN|nr:STM3941 family protein [Pontixanthobacter aquaemixtae]MXO90452.1 hypothetical protein [Pontixanthobacter aquaemixtae]
MIEGPDQNHFEAHYSPWRLLLLSLLGIGFVSAGLWMIGAFGEPPTPRRLSPEMAYAIGWVCILFFGALAVFLLKKAMTGGLAVRVDQVGIFDARVSDTIIPWASIVSMGSYSIRQTKFFGFELSDAGTLNLKRYTRMSAAANRSLTGFPYAISMTGTDKSHSDLLAAIDRFAPRSI